MKVVIPALCVYQKFNVLPIRKLHQFQLLYIVHKYVYLRSQLPMPYFMITLPTTALFMTMTLVLKIMYMFLVFTQNMAKEH